MNKQEKITAIKDIIDLYGSFSINELFCADCPVFNVIGKHIILIEYINKNDVDCTEYVNDLDVAEHSYSYDELSEENLDEILVLAQQYALSEENLFNTTKNENF